MIVGRTQRLVLRRLDEDDAAFVLELLNEPSWLRFIGDKNVHTLDDARRYVRDGPVAMYAQHGFGLYLVERSADGAPLGICGLIRRDTLPDVDLGFAFLPRYWGQGYAREAAGATLRHGRDDLRLGRVVAITAQDNDASVRLLEAVGMRFERRVRLKDNDEPLKLFATDLAPARTAALP